MIIDISSKEKYPANALSNFTPRSFVFDGVACGSIEGVLQAIKFPDVTTQEQLCLMVGGEAKRAGKKSDWKQSQTLHWRGTTMARESEEYGFFMSRLYSTVFEQDASFRRAINASGVKTLKHTMGKKDKTQTVLTEQEFCEQLDALRRRGK